MEYQYFCQTDIQFISRHQLKEQMIKISNRNILFIISKSSAARWDFQDIITLMTKKNNMIWLDSVNANPTQQDVYYALQFLNKQPVDLIIAIGGGSTIDLAKAISTFYNSKEISLSLDLLVEKIKQKSYKGQNEFIDIIAIPTTAGTGSELTHWATIWDMNQQVKYSIDHIELKPKKAYIIPELTLSLSQDLTLSTCFDAFSHAVEAYWSKHTNPLVQDLAFRAIQLLLENLHKVLSDPCNLRYRELICRASVLAGLAFSQTRTTACHSISYPLTMLYGIPHGYAVALTLGEIALRNKGNFPNDEEFYSLFNPYNSIQDWIDQVSTGIARLRLSSFHIKRDDIPYIAKNAFTSGRMDNNPIIFTEYDVKTILENIY